MISAIELPQQLWDIINFFKIDNTFFAFAGKGVSYLEVICTLTGLLCVFLAVRGKVANFWIGYLYNILLFLLFLQNHLYSSMLLQPISLGINFYGHYRWTHPHDDEKNYQNKLRITKYTGGQRIVVVAAIFMFMLVWGYILSRVDVWFPSIFAMAQMPYFDAFILGTVLTAQYLSAQKKIDCWWAWMVANTCNIILCAMAGLRLMTIVYVAYLILACAGYLTWRTQRRKEELEWERLKKAAVKGNSTENEKVANNDTVEGN